MELASRQSTRTTTGISLRPAIDLPRVAALPLVEAEAELRVELDRVLALSEQDPMVAVKLLVDLMLGIDIELMKSMAPMLLEAAQTRAQDFAAGGKLTEPSGPEGRALASLLKTQNAIMQLGASKVRIADELRRRGYDVSESPSTVGGDERKLLEDGGGI
jgi:hypothetical protein